ncbi:MAG: protein disulfide oxidoreductase [Candidatus Aenigmatarchaeota archaeon]
MQMLIDEESRRVLEEKFEKEMKRNVEIYYFVEKHEHSHDEHSHHEHIHLDEIVDQFLQELSELSKGKIEIKKFGLNSKEAKEFSVDRNLTIIIDPRNGYRIFYIGSPLGEEAWAFIDTIVQVSKDESNISKKSKEKLKDLNKNVEIQVFVTPQCPYCPYQVLLVNNIAIEKKGLVHAKCIESLENPDLADKFNVQAVPHTVINEKQELIGVQPEDRMVEAILKEG